MPILDSLRRLVVNVHSCQLNQWDCELPPTLPGNSHEHFVLADVVRWHATHVDHLANSQRRCNTLSYTAGLEWKTQVFLEVVVPADCLFFGLRINDDLPLEASFELVVAASAKPYRLFPTVWRTSASPSTPSAGRLTLGRRLARKVGQSPTCPARWPPSS
jgi:hypothetical protein